MQIFVPGIETYRLEQRLVFLEDRAKAYLGAWEGAADVAGERAILSRACAAKLLRDAACVALLLGWMDDARRFLLEAGRHFLTLGMPVCAALVTLAELGQSYCSDERPLSEVSFPKHASPLTARFGAGRHFLV